MKNTNEKEVTVKFRFVCMVNLNCILAIFPEWGQKVPPFSLFGGEKRPQNSKMASFCALIFWNLESKQDYNEIRT